MIVLDERLKVLLEEGRIAYRIEKGVSLWANSEAGFVIAESGTLFDVSYWSRGRTNPPELTGATSLIVQVYMAVFIWQRLARYSRHAAPQDELS